MGVQAGQFFGDVHAAAPASQPATDLAAQLAALREDVDRAFRAGALDEATHEAAAEELAQADALAGEPASNASPLITTLKKLNGLIGDVAVLATRVAAIVGAVRGIR